MSLASSLPGELINAIIGYLPDRQSIKVCSLISRVWVPWTRVHLFSQFRLMIKNLLPFLLLLQSPYCTFPCYVRRISIDAYLAAMPNSYHKILLEVLKGPHTWLDQECAAPRVLFRKLGTSRANVVDRSNPGHLINLICLFPAVEHLDLLLSAFYFGVGNCDGLPFVSHTLKSLALNGSFHPRCRTTRQYQWGNLMKWIHRHQIRDISALYLHAMGPWSVDGAETLLKIQGSSLRHLHVGSPLPGKSHIPLNIIHNPCLESVHYELGKPSSQIVADTFSAISSNTITILGLDIRHESLRDAEEVCQLKRLGAILASQNFSRVSRILVRLEYDSYLTPGPDVEHDWQIERTRDYSLNVIYGAFQFAKTRGILEVEHLTYERRRFTRHVTDDCFSTKVLVGR